MEKARKNGRKSVRGGGNSGGTGYRPAWWRGGAVRKTAAGQPSTRGNAVRKAAAKPAAAKRPATKSSAKPKASAKTAVKRTAKQKAPKTRNTPVIGKIEFLIQDAPPVSRPSANRVKREFRKSVF